MSVIYKAAVSIGDKVVPRALQPLWQHPAGELNYITFTYLKTLRLLSLCYLLQVRKLYSSGLRYSSG